MYSLIFVIFAFTILYIFLWPFFARFLGVGPNTGFLISMRVFITFAFIIMSIPISVMIELFYSRLKGRKFRLRNFLLLFAPLCEFMLVLNAVGLAFQLAFPRLSLTNEPFTGLTGIAIGMMVALPLLAIGLTSRIPKLRAYLMKSFE
jgi:hypothetical protein